MEVYKEPWDLYESPRRVQSLHTPWIPSPGLLQRDRPRCGGHVHDIVHPSQQLQSQDSVLSGRNILCGFRALRRFMGECFLLCSIRKGRRSCLALPARDSNAERKHGDEGTVYHSQRPESFHFPVSHTSQSQCKEIPQVSLAEWRAFAEHSRPIVNGVGVHNTFSERPAPIRIFSNAFFLTAPSPTPYRNIDLDELDLEELFQSLRSPGGHTHPELWIPGIRHPSLPPPPIGWPLPRPGEPLPFPWECQVNPFLQHAVCGPAPVYWNIRAGDLAILYGGPMNVTIPLTPADLAQPATCPLLTHMYVSGLALADARFPWKFMVVNPAGIRVRDVFTAILENFQHFVFRTEYEQWSVARQRHAELEWVMRGGPEMQDGLRRIDYLGGQLCFRGIAPNPDRTGWVLFVGAEW
jgi:hypothetical protein